MARIERVGDASVGKGKLRSWGVLLLLVAGCYLPVLDGPYLADDYRLFPRPLKGLDLGLLRTNERYMRPLPGLSMQAEHLLWGSWTIGAHVTNLVLHVLTTLLVGVLARRLTGDRAVGLCSAALFGLHPIHAGTVSWLSARFDLFCAALGLAAVLKLDDFLNEGRRRDLVLSLLAFCLALLSKEAAVAFLPILLLWSMLRGARPSRSGWWRWVPFGLALALYLLVRSAVVPKAGIDPASLSPAKVTGGLSSALVLLALPLDVGQWGRLFGPLSGAQGGLLAVTLLQAAAAARSRGSLRPSRALLFGLGTLLLALLTHAPVLYRLIEGVPPTRVLYTPAVGYCLVLGLALGQLHPKVRARLLSCWVLLGAAGLVGNNLAWRRAGEIVERVLAQVEERATDAERPVAHLLVQDVPRYHNGAYVFLGAELQYALWPVLGTEVRIVAVNERRKPLRAVDLRLVGKPQRWGALRWDPEGMQLVDLTHELRSGIQAGRIDLAPGRTWTGGDLADWDPGEPSSLDPGGLTLRVSERTVRLPCPPLPPNTLQLVVKGSLQKIGPGDPSVRVVARWSEEGAGPSGEELHVDLQLLEGEGEFELRFDAPHALRIEDLSWEALRVELLFRLEGYEARLESLQLTTTAELVGDR